MRKTLDLALITQMYESGMSQKEIAEIFKCWQPTICLALRRAGVKCRSVAAAEEPKIEGRIMLRYPTGGSTAEFTPVPAGSHVAVCDIVADIGLQPGSQLFPKPKQQVYIRFELPNERIEFEKDGKKQVGPAVIGKFYTASMNEKANLRHLLESWRGRQFTDAEAAEFDISVVLGKPGMLMVMQTQKEKRTYSNISGIGPLPKGIDPKTIIAEGTPILYTPENTETYIRLPEWLRKKIDGQIIEEPVHQQSAPENGRGDAWDGAEITDDDIPF